MQTNELSVATIDAIRKTFVETGDDWIVNYPALLKGYLERWELTITGVASGGRPTNLVYFVRTKAGESLVLKMGHPHPESIIEALALDLYQEAGTNIDPQFLAHIELTESLFESLRHVPD